MLITGCGMAVFEKRHLGLVDRLGVYKSHIAFYVVAQMLKKNEISGPNPGPPFFVFNIYIYVHILFYFSQPPFRLGFRFD